MSSALLTVCSHCNAKVHRKWTACVACGAVQEPTIPALVADVSESTVKAPSAVTSVQPLSADYPCTVCGSTDRWQDHGVWRCKACWPKGQRKARAVETPTDTPCRRCGDTDPLATEVFPDESKILRCGRCQRPREVVAQADNAAQRQAA